MAELQEDPAEKRARERAERREKELARIKAAGGLNLGNLPGLRLGHRGGEAPAGAASGITTHRSMELNRIDAELREEMTDK